MAWILLDVYQDGRIVLELLETIPALAAKDITVGRLRAGVKYYLTGPLSGDLPGLGFGTIMFEGDQVGRKDIHGFANHVKAVVNRYRKAMQHSAQAILRARADTERAEKYLEWIDDIITNAHPRERVPKISAMLRRWRDGKAPRS